MTINWAEVTELSSEDAAYLYIQIYYIGTFQTKGMSTRQIAKKLKVSNTSVINLLKHLGVKLRLRGGRNYYKKVNISEKDFRTLTYQELVKKYKVCASTIWKRTRHFKQKPNRRNVKEEV